MAHELGHLVLDFGPKVDDEDAAHRFAEAILMPAEALWAMVGKRRTSIGWSELFDVKRLFGVSVQALTHRCKHLGVFGNVLFERLCFRALAEGAIPASKAAELLGITVHDLNRQMEQPPEADAASAS